MKKVNWKTIVTVVVEVIAGIILLSALFHWL